MNIITLIFESKLDFKICFTNVRAQKIDTSILKIIKIVLTNFEIKDKLDRP